MNVPKIASAALLAGLLMAQSAAALPLIILDENGNGTVDVGGGPVLQSGTLQADPGPGGLASALTYTLAGSPAGLVAGDVFLQEPGGILDLLRFNPIGTGGSTENAIVFYSAVGGPDLADTGLPGLNYAKPVTISEVGGVANYTPTATDPGFFAGLAVQYTFTSTPLAGSAPEINGPSALAPLAFSFFLVMIGANQRRRQSAVA